MRKGIVAIFVAALMAFGCLACNTRVETPKNKEDDAVVASSQELRLLDTDIKVSQDDMLSRIRADAIKTVGGYRKGDEVGAIINLDGDALVDTYLSSERISQTMTVGEYAASSVGKTRAHNISYKQEEFIQKLNSCKLINSVTHRYSTVMNGIAVKLPYGNIEAIEGMAGVKSVILSETYNKPQAISVEDTSSIINDVDVYETGIFNSASVSFTGKGTAVAILDSGFDCSHSVFTRQPEGELWLTQQDISDSLPETNAAGATKGLKLTDVWYSNKIPFAYDYADKDYDVFPYDSDHGTHVAGVIGGKDEKITGVAIDTQLVLMKVFPDRGNGAEDEDILAALEDAIILGVDAINMSLGISCGFTREEDGSHMNEVYDKLADSGISLLAAASNSHTSAFNGKQGNTNKVTNPDCATVGAPSTFDSPLSVASISGVKSSYLCFNNDDVVFFTESSSITGKENDFIKEMYETYNIPENESRTFEYVTVPGYGKRVNYDGLDVAGKIALVKRGDTTFEDKALRARNAGAIACIIYNNIEGDISMSMGKTGHIPTVSIKKEEGVKLASVDSGTVTVSNKYKAGPFMSDFSSWGPTPALELKPEITAHGGRIVSSIPGGGYDEMSGTSMATPNLCGIVILIRQFLKEKFPTYTQKQIVALANQMLMSTATVVINEEGNPYSPRQQGAGLASLYNVVNTKAYLSVDGKEKTKIELKDDPKRTGKYNMAFNVVNISDTDVSYDLSLVAMTETVSSSDKDFVAQKSGLLSNSFRASVKGGSLSGNKITVKANSTAAVELVYTMSAADKKLIDSQFPYGMYVEGFVRLKSRDEGIDLNVPFLAFYGDWMQAPLFDKTYYEVETQAHDESIDDEDKIKADYYATTPYGSYFYNYIIPFGMYIYDVPEGYDKIEGRMEHASVSSDLGTIDGVSAVYGGLLRNAKTMTYTITDKLTGNVIKEYVDHNAAKAHSEGGDPIPYYELLNWKTRDMSLTNNREYEFKMVGTLDYGDGGVTANMNNTFKFDFTYDNEAPIIKSASYEKIYDTTQKKDRYYLDLVVYDNHYAMSVLPITFTSTSSYTQLADLPIPIYSEKGKDNKIRIEITDYLDDRFYDAIISSSLGFIVDDYALNANIYLCQLPGTRGDFAFTQDGSIDGPELGILTVYEDEVVDLTKYLATGDLTVDADKDYLKYLHWNCSNDAVARVEQGKLLALAPGRVTVTVTEQMNLKRATLLVNVKARPAEQKSAVEQSLAEKAPLYANEGVQNVEDAVVESLRFSYFDTKFAYSRSAQTSMIGATGAKIFLSSIKKRLTIYPGEKLQLHYDIQPWYVDGKYVKHYASSDKSIIDVDENGVLTALKKGAATITLSLEGSNLMARLPITVNSEFVIEDRTLIAYKGIAYDDGVPGRVKIPDDEGIINIGMFAFCLYETDTSIELTEDDYDANKVPSANATIKEVIIPDGVEDVQKYAFYNCTGLKKVVLPDTVKYVRDYCFYGCTALTDINLTMAYTVGPYCFYGCTALETIPLNRVYAIADYGFAGCTALKSVDLTALRNTGKNVFYGCTALESVKMNEQGHTKLATHMFEGSGLTSVDIYATVAVPEYCFADCKELASVNIHNDLVSIDKCAFSGCEKLASVKMKKVNTIDEKAFCDCDGLAEITLPDCAVNIKLYAFYDCNVLTTVKLGAHTEIVGPDGSVFRGSPITSFVVDAASDKYKTAEGGKYLTDKTGKKIVFAAVGVPQALTIDASNYTEICSGAFAGCDATSLTVTKSGSAALEIADYAFENSGLQQISIAAGAVKSIGERAFYGCSALTAVTGLDSVKNIGDYAFALTAVPTVKIGAANVGEGAFFRSGAETVTVAAPARLGASAFAECGELAAVTITGDGLVHVGEGCFSDCKKLNSFDFNKLDADIENSAFYGCISLTAVKLVNAEHIGDYAFGDCYGITELTFPKVKTIGEGAFGKYDERGGAPAITSLELPETLTGLGSGAFLGSESLTKVVILGAIEEVPDFAFSFSPEISEVKLPESVKRIGDYAFASCTELKKINLGKVEKFGEFALAGCSVLDTVDISGAKEIGVGAFANTAVKGNLTASELVAVDEYAFQNADVTSLTAGKLAYIGEFAFENNAHMREFIFGQDIKHVGIGAFYGCAELGSFYYQKADAKLNDGEINDYAMLKNGVLYTVMQNGDVMLSSIPAAKDLSRYEVAERTTVIQAFAGNASKKIKTLVLPDSLRSIGNYAFYGYDNLNAVEFRSITAPALDSDYDPELKLYPGDPGYELLHNQYGMFGLELCYCNFIDLAGKKNPISMILPANAGIRGYDSAVYTAYFGTVEDARRSTYFAMDVDMREFITYAKAIMRIKQITFADEDLVINAINALEATKSVSSDYGYSEEEWSEMVDAVYAAKKEIDRMRAGITPEPDAPVKEINYTGAIIAICIVAAMFGALLAVVIVKRKEDKE